MTAFDPQSSYILSAKRTPMGAFQGALSTVPATELGASAIAAAVAEAGIDKNAIDEVFMGSVLQAGLKQAPARQAMIAAGLNMATGATTINKVCGSGMKSVMLANDLIKAGSVDVVVSGGMESMSLAPYILEKARAGLRMGHSPLKDHMFLDGLEDWQTADAMGCFAQAMSETYKFSREQMDDYAIHSLKRAQQAIEKNYFVREMVAVDVQTRKGTMQVSVDEQPLSASAEKIPTLKPAFKKDGTVTAANSSSISDGASALVIASGRFLQGKNIKPMARIVAHATNSRLPAEFTIAPVGAIEKVLVKAGWRVADVDLFEINEAFAMVAMAAIHDLKLDHQKVNVNGGACSLGHPLGSSGSRIIVTLIHELQRRGLKKGIASLCIGGGEATAIAIEIVDQASFE
jgi:acetyl-CoA C-acetyltransferase